MKKIIAMILTVLMCASIVMTGIISAAEDTMPFTDVKDTKWFYSAVKAVWEKGVMEGKSETQFAPNEEMTRAQLVTILYRLAGAETEGLAESLTFKDTKKSAWYAEYVGWAVKEGLVNGYEDNTFKPNSPVLRQELAKLFSTFIDYAGFEISGEVLIDSFTDAAKHPSWAKEFIEDLRAIGLVGGDAAGNFNPKSTATRAEVATIITRLLPAVFPEDTTDPETTDPDVTDPETTEPEVTDPVEQLPEIKVYPDDDWKNVAAPSDDPTPENIGSVYSDEEIGLVISQAVRVDNNGTEAKIAGTGIHGGHEVKVVRTRYGTFAAFVTGDTAQEGRTMDEMSFFEITSNGCRLIYKDEFNHANGSCVPNVLQGENGIIYIILMNEDWNASSARLTLYTYDAKTDTYTKDVQLRKFDVPSNQVHGYGYTQPVLDEQFGKIYAIYNGGDVPGYVAWFVYDIPTATWENDCYTINVDWRICYANAYPDGNGGFLFVEQRDATVAALRELLGVDFRVQTGYLWDAIVLVHIPDAHKEEFTMKDIFMPEYSTTEEKVTHSGAGHYGSGATLLDSKGNLHVVYTQAYGSKANIYYAVYDKNLNEVRNSTINLTSSKKSYTFALAEGTDGTVYIIAINTYMTQKETQVEVWKTSDDMKTLKKVCSPQTVSVKGAEGEDAALMPTKLIAGTVRNGSDKDGYVPIVMYQDDGNGSYDYYYFSVKLPD